MKKGISILLAAVLLLSLGVTGWAEEDGITAAKVYQWLEEGDEASETVEDQAANGALRLAEMMVVLDSFCIETEEDADHLNSILDKLSEVLNVPVGGTTPDGRFTLEATRCLGACGLAPVMTINEEVYGRLTPDAIPDIIAKYRKAE